MKDFNKQELEFIKKRAKISLLGIALALISVGTLFLIFKK